jgi:hypothetical protein
LRRSSRRTARAILGGGFPTGTLSICAAGSQFPMIGVSVQPSSHPGRSDFPSPVGGGSFSHDTPSARVEGSSARPPTPSRLHVIRAALPLASENTLFRLCVRACRCAAAAAHRESLCFDRRYPAIPLLRTHAPDRHPPGGFSLPYSVRSLQVVPSPCCTTALPDIISAILAWALGSLPRHVSTLRLSVTSR